MKLYLVKLTLFIIISILITTNCLRKTINSWQQNAIQPYKENPHYWQYKGKPVLLVGGSKDDNLFQLPDLKQHLDSLAIFGGNVIRNVMSSRQDKGWEVYRFKQLEDGKYDLDQWNEEYWHRFENMLKWTIERDIIVQIEVWDRFDYSQKNWLTCPWNPANNINYTFEESGLDPEYPQPAYKDKQPFFFTIPGMSRYQPKYDIVRYYQEKYVDKMLSFSLNYNNVLYCMDNETSTPPEWGQYWMQRIRDKAAKQGKKVYVTDMFDDFWRGDKSKNFRLVFDHPELYNFVDISQVNSRNFDQKHWDQLRKMHEQVKEHPRPLNNTKIYGGGESSWGSGTNKDGIERFWRQVIGGSASARAHRPNAGNGLNRKMQASLKAVPKMETLVKMWDVEPHMELLSDREPDEAYLAADPGKEYALYFTDGGSVGLDLTKASGQFVLKWINITNGEWGDETVVSGGDVFKVTAPDPGGWVAVIVKRQ